MYLLLLLYVMIVLIICYIFGFCNFLRWWKNLMVLCNFVGYSLTINWSIEVLVSDIQLALQSFKKCQALHVSRHLNFFFFFSANLGRTNYAPELKTRATKCSGIQEGLTTPKQETDNAHWSRE